MCVLIVDSASGCLGTGSPLRIFGKAAELHVGLARLVMMRAAYLGAWLAEASDDAAGITRALGDIARAAGMTDVAKATGLSRESLYRALSVNGNPSFATILKVARAVGVRLHAEVSPSRRD